mgnify:CR=1 FL=1
MCKIEINFRLAKVSRTRLKNMEIKELPRVFSGHETFPLRQSWLSKLNKIADNSMINKKLFAEDDLVAKFGVGKNMVASMRHWGLASGMFVEQDENLCLTPHYARLFRNDLVNRGHGQKAYFALDPFFERSDSVWFVHWRLTAFPLRSTTWFWLFNRISSPTFTKDDLLQSLSIFLEANEGKASDTTLLRDVETCLRSYVPKLDAKGGVEDASDSLLVELGLLREDKRGFYSFKRGPKPTLSPSFFAFCLAEYWEKKHQGSNQLSFELISYADSSPGKVFKLDDESLMDFIDQIEMLTKGLFSWSSTAGVRQLVRDEKLYQSLKAKGDEDYLLDMFCRVYE